MADTSVAILFIEQAALCPWVGIVDLYIFQTSRKILHNLMNSRHSFVTYKGHHVFDDGTKNGVGCGFACVPVIQMLLIQLSGHY